MRRTFGWRETINNYTDDGLMCYTTLNIAVYIAGRFGGEKVNFLTTQPVYA